MAETLVEKLVCTVCDAEARKGALFCYHCGGAIVTEVTTAANGDSVSNGWFRENIGEDEAKVKEAEKSKVTSKLEAEVAEKIGKSIEKPTDLPIEKPTESIEKPTEKPTEKTTEKTTENLTENPKAAEKTKLKSAAEMRRKTRTLQKNRVEEVVWEEHENAPNGWFIIVALILILIAAGLFFVAVYMK